MISPLASPNGRRYVSQIAAVAVALVLAACGDANTNSPGDADAPGDAAAPSQVDQALACAAGLSNCSDVCVNLSADPMNCGLCAHACGYENAGALCQGGMCGQGPCAQGFADCNGDDSDGCESAPAMDVANCGACGNSCQFAHAAPTCVAGACVMGACDPGYFDCDGNAANGCETNIGGDIANCGACKAVCPGYSQATPVCVNGACALGACNAGYGNCDNIDKNGCEAWLIHAGSCGACGVQCAYPNATGQCTVKDMNGGKIGVCVMDACNFGFGDCANGAADGCEANLKSDPNNCGACGKVCGQGNVCTGGQCLMACGNGLTNCANACVDLQSDSNNCGKCATSCNVPNGTGTCLAGVCQPPQCRDGYGNCDGNAGNGCETDVTTSVGNCGACGQKCVYSQASATCVAAACVMGACNAGYADCDGAAIDGCEVALNSDVSNCGGCGKACGPVARGAAACVQGSCAVGSCVMGFADCDGKLANGCEVFTSLDPKNCGGCGNACTFPNAGAQCAAGVCTLGACNGGFGDCDAKAANGCETDLSSTTGHCGDCGTICVAPAVCTGGKCVRACTVGQTHCNDGCWNLQTDANNCGACGHACQYANAVGVCQGGVCSMGACNPLFGDCDKMAANGCEVPLDTLANCAGCGVTCTSPDPRDTLTCAKGVCQITQCWGPSLDCNKDPKDDCEVFDDPNNCPACGVKCPNLPHMLVNCPGQCSYQCDSGWWNDCDGILANGCETPLIDQNNCGACGVVCAGNLSCQQCWYSKNIKCAGIFGCF